MRKGQSCESCWFFDPENDKTPIYGDCRRFPPLPVNDRISPTTRFPHVHRLEWCGEFKPKVEATAREAGATQ